MASNPTPRIASSRPYLVLGLALAVTLLVTLWVGSTARAGERVRFQSAVVAATTDVDRRLETYVALLTATAAHFGVRDSVTRREFYGYVDQLRLRSNYPGVYGIGYSIRIPPGRGAELVADMRRQGDSSFALGERPPAGGERHAIVYLGPLDRRNREAIGFDMFADPVRRAAMERARDSAMPSASGRVMLVQEIDPLKQFGFLIYLPVYEGGDSPATVAERRARLRGFVYSPFRVGDLLEAVVDTSVASVASLEVFDGEAAEPSRRLYATPGTGAPPPFALQQEAGLDVAGRPWTLRFTSRPESGPPFGGALIFGGVGLLASLLLFRLARAQGRAQSAALRAAHELEASDAALELSERRFRSLLEQSPLGTQLLAPDGRTLLVNRAWEELWGLRLSDVQEYDILHDPQLEAKGVAPLLRRAFAGEPVVLPPRSYVPSVGPTGGRERWVRAVAYPVKDEGGRVREVVLVHEDISERRQSESRLRYQLALMDAITSNAAESLFLLDAAGRVTFMNPAAERTFGWSRDELVGQVLHDMLHRLHADGRPYPTAECPLRAILESGHPLRNHEDVFLRRDGSFVPVSCSITPIVRDGEVTGAVLVVHDIGERKAAEVALRQSEERFRAIFSQVRVGMVQLMLDGTFALVNGRCCEMLGYRREELLGRRLQEVVHPDDVAALVEGLERLAADGETFSAELRLQHRNDIPIWTKMTISAVRDAGGQPTYAVVVLEDVTERRRTEEALRHTQKLESIGVLAGGIAHDFNNLLTGIMGNASLALQSLGSLDPARSMLEDVIHAGERAAELTSQLLAYAGKGRFVLRQVDLARLVREISGLIHSSIPRKVQVRLELAADLPPLRADASQLQQLVMNLVINGAEAIGDEAGEVTVCADRVRVDEEAIALEYASYGIEPGWYVRLVVEDSGRGMDRETMRQIFDPFYTTKFLGRGLGLAAAQGIVRGHGGALTVRSSPGQGSTFTVLLPPAAGVEEPAAEESAQGTASADGAGGGRGRILVVEDEGMLRQLATIALGEAGFDVVAVGDGRAAVEALRRDPHAVTLVLLDLTMPIMGGEEAIVHLRELRPDLPVIVTSGYGEAATLERFAGKGASLYLPKPYTADRLLATIREVLE